MSFPHRPVLHAGRLDYPQTRLIDFPGATKGSSIPYLQRMFNDTAHLTANELALTATSFH
jgi:hypothetical protein